MPKDFFFFFQTDTHYRQSMKRCRTYLISYIIKDILVVLQLYISFFSFWYTLRGNAFIEAKHASSHTLSKIYCLYFNYISKLFSVWSILPTLKPWKLFFWNEKAKGQKAEIHRTGEWMWHRGGGLMAQLIR